MKFLIYDVGTFNKSLKRSLNILTLMNKIGHCDEFTIHLDIQTA